MSVVSNLAVETKSEMEPNRLQEIQQSVNLTERRRSYFSFTKLTAVGFATLLLTVGRLLFAKAAPRVEFQVRDMLL